MGTTVLVVEDDEEVRDSFVSVLEDEGYRVISARDGSEGLVAAAANRPDVILLDLMMPGMDGFSFRREQQRKPGISGVPVVVVAAQGSARLAASMGAAGYLRKPTSVDALVRAIDSAVASR
jgi:CheY-like chemotaxis protein